MLKLPLLTYHDQLRTQTKGGKPVLYDPFRKKWVHCTPEELVRQLFLHYLVHEKSYPMGRIAIEKQLHWNGMRMRFDALAYAPDSSPLLLIECKAATVPLSEDTLQQNARYNIKIQSLYQVVTNGIDTYCFLINYENKTAEWQSAIPAYPRIKTFTI